MGTRTAYSEGLWCLCVHACVHACRRMHAGVYACRRARACVRACGWAGGVNAAAVYVARAVYVGDCVDASPTSDM
jgi:hypothetical protein